ncbi:MAG: transglycosylase domain-containing protein, partial [Clostridia bacterium]|nr:transglycosylase domain-containing protein [Clostridia bacterium]
MDKKQEAKNKPATKTEQTPYTYSFWSIFINTFGTTFKTLIIVVLLVGVIVGCLGLGMVIGWIETADTISEEELEITTGLTTFIYDANGNVITKLTGSDNINRETVGYDGIPLVLEHAIVSIEDERFYEHRGFDIIRILSSVYALVINRGEIEQGGSTLTQQVYKNYTNRFETTFERKFQELYNSIILERKLDKKSIITLYANIVNAGNGCYGFQSASKLYFGKELKDVTLPEAAFLAGIPNAPSLYNPYTEEGYEETLTRMKNILDKMLELGFISEETHETARETRVEIQPRDETLQTNKATSYFVDEVIKDVTEALMLEMDISKVAAERIIYNNGLSIYTTMDPDIQASVDEVFLDEETYFNEYDEEGKRLNIEAEKYGEKPQGAVVVMNHYTGEIVAMYGGSGEKNLSRTLNRATETERQPGSSFKPIAVYGPALELEIITAATVFDDVPSYLDPKNPEVIYPKNYEANVFYGLTPVRNAIKSSVNVIAAKVWTILGRDNAVSFLDSVGIDRGDIIYDDTTVSTATGGLARGVNPLEMANAFATFANKGVYIEGYTFTEVKNQNDEVILKNQPDFENVYRSQTAYLMTDIMSGVNTGWDEFPHGGTAQTISIGNEEKGYMPVAGKTGTTSDYLDKWFVGYTPYYTAAVWYGYDNRIAPIELVPGTWRTREDGTRYRDGEYNRAVVLWDAVMDRIHEDLEIMEFERPITGLVEREVCIYSGKSPSELCYQDPRYPSWHAPDCIRMELFIEGTEPSYFDTCTVHQEATVCVDSFDPFGEHVHQEDPYGRYLMATPECPEASLRTIVGIVRPVPYVPYMPDPEEEIIEEDDDEEDENDFKYPLIAQDMKWEIIIDEYCVVHGMQPDEGETDIVELDPETGLPIETPEPS